MVFSGSRKVAAALLLQLFTFYACASGPSVEKDIEALVKERAQIDVSLADCDYSGLAVISRPTKGVVRFCGKIEDEAVRFLQSSLRSDDIILELASAGGSLSAPLDLAGIVHSRRMQVVVLGPCFSGCAAFVVAAASKRTIGRQGLLGFHNTNSSALALIIAGNNGALPKGFEPLAERGMSERILYHRKRLGLALLYDPQALIGPICVRPTGRKADQGEPVVDIVTADDLWLPTAEMLASYGYNVDGSLPEAIHEAEQRFRHYAGAGVLVPKFNTEIAEDIWDSDHKLLRTRQCRRGETPEVAVGLPGAE